MSDTGFLLYNITAVDSKDGQKSAILPHRRHCHCAQSPPPSWAARGCGHAVSKQTREGNGLDVTLCLEKQALFHLGVV